jgi:hypothetical protein
MAEIPVSVEPHDHRDLLGTAERLTLEPLNGIVTSLLTDQKRNPCSFTGKLA